MKKVEDIQVKGKRVLVRCDFNVPLDKEGNVVDDIRIREAAPTINYLIKEGAKVIVMSHLGSPKNQRNIGEKTSLLQRLSRKRPEGSIYPIKEHLSLAIKRPVDFVNDCIGEKVNKRISEMEEGQVLLLENVRFYKEEKENSMDFARRLSSLADVYINDAFSVSHRNHASVASVSRFLPSAAGMLLQKEINTLQEIKKDKRRPLVVVIGGAKIKSKMSAVSYFLKNADHVILGGKLANAVLVVRNISIGQDMPEDDVVRAVEENDFTSPKAHIPVDVIASPDHTGSVYVRETAPAQVRGDEDILDIGSETIKMYGEIIKEAGAIIWIGPLGLFEEKSFETGTREIADRIIRNHRALKIVGGGDTISALAKFDLLEKMDHYSCGGGALLAYISESPMPGLEGL